MANKKKFCAMIFTVITSFIVSGGISVASSFPFRAISPGDLIPEVKLNSYKDQKELALSSYKGKVFVSVFWGGDVPTKKERSINALKELQELGQFFEERKIPAIVVNVQEDSPDVIDEVMTKSENKMPQFIDNNQSAYGNLGIFVMPAILLVDKEGRVAAGMGYSHDFVERLRGEIEILLGEKSREDVEHELRPEMVEKSAEEKDAKRHMNMGYVMLKRLMPDAALREFQDAVKIYPDISAEAYIEIGCILFDKEQYDKSGEYIDKGLEMNPDSLRGLICDAKLTAQAGELDDAISDLQSIMLRKSRNPELHYVLGTFYERQGKNDLAMKEFRKAYELLEHKASMAQH